MREKAKGSGAAVQVTPSATPADPLTEDELSLLHVSLFYIDICMYLVDLVGSYAYTFTRFFPFKIVLQQALPHGQGGYGLKKKIVCFL